MQAVRDGLMIALAGVGLFFMLVAAIGVLRMPDLFTRMHAATKASTLGISGIALAALMHFADATVAPRVLLIILFFFLTAPVGAHALGRAAYICGIELAPRTRRFDLQRARILCPTRGGPPSLRLHEKAIELARETLGELTFLYIINRELVEAAAEPGEAMRALAELRALGQNIVETVQSLAQARGVPTARGEVRMGEIVPEIIRMTQEIEANLVVLGYPEQGDPTTQQAAEEQLWALTNAVQAQTGAQVIIAR